MHSSTRVMFKNALLEKEREEKNPSGIWTHNLLITRCALWRCGSNAALIQTYYLQSVAIHSVQVKVKDPTDVPISFLTPESVVPSSSEWTASWWAPCIAWTPARTEACSRSCSGIASSASRQSGFLPGPGLLRTGRRRLATAALKTKTINWNIASEVPNQISYFKSILFCIHTSGR